MMKMRGFTLIELIVVIVLIGITAVTMSIFIGGTVSGYLDNAQRQDSAAIARVALDRIGRELRTAMPQSVRVQNNCLEFLPVRASTIYIDLPINTATVKTVDFVWPGGNGLHAALYPLNTPALYPLSTLPTVTDGGVVANIRTLNLLSSFTAPQYSSGERLYIVGGPISFCIEANGANAVLMRYENYGLSAAAQPAPGAGLINGAILVDKLVAAASSFQYQAGNWQQNSLVTITLRFLQQNNETLTVDHEVWLRNAQ